MSLKNVLTKQSYLDLDYVYGTLSNSTGSHPLDFQALMNNPTPLLVPATNALTGSTKYFSKADLRQDSYDI